jgi:peptidyl-dipeptidase Dcp
MENPLLIYKNDTPDSYIRFDLIKDEHFEPAFDAALLQAKENLQKVIANPEPPTFENTVEALEYLSDDLDRVASIFSNIKEAHTNDTIDAIAMRMLPKLSEFANDIALSEALFDRVKIVYENNSFDYTSEQYRLLSKTYEGFARGGALLSHGDKQTLREYDNRLALLIQTYNEHVLAATNAYSLHILDENDLAGLPARIRSMARDEALAQGKEGWMFTLDTPSAGPFLQYVDNAILRKELLIAAKSRCMSGEFDNRAIVLEVLELRNKRAILLGYSNHAAFVLEDRMAQTVERVEAFLASLYQISRPLAEKDFETLRAYKESLSGEVTLYPWDVSYYEEKLKSEQFNFDEERVRSYFNLTTVLEGLFEHAHRLYGLMIKDRLDVPVYHEDVRVVEIRKESGEYLGLLYIDLFPRKNKSAGGWIDALRGQHKRQGNNLPTQLLIVCNFTKPDEKGISLLSFSEVETLFHEFGHALHDLLSDCTYASLSGTNVYRDFVELPSQLLESWVGEKESLMLFAKHYQTQELITDELTATVLKNKNFFSGWNMLGQVSSATLDIQLHSRGGQIEDLESFETTVLNAYRFFPHIVGTSHAVTFRHIFGGDYDVGYYSYHWAEALAADAFEYFKEHGLFSKEIAEKFRASILSKGNTQEPIDLYRAFRGRDADPRALFRYKGLL